MANHCRRLYNQCRAAKYSLATLSWPLSHGLNTRPSQQLPSTRRKQCRPANAPELVRLSTRFLTKNCFHSRNGIRYERKQQKSNAKLDYLMKYVNNYSVSNCQCVWNTRALFISEREPKGDLYGFSFNFLYFTSSRFSSHNATRLMEYTLVVDFFVLKHRLLRSASTAIDSEIASFGTIFMVAQRSWLTTMITRRQHVSSAIVVTLPRMADVTTCFAVHAGWFMKVTIDSGCSFFLAIFSVSWPLLFSTSHLPNRKWISESEYELRRDSHKPTSA